MKRVHTCLWFHALLEVTPMPSGMQPAQAGIDRKIFGGKGVRSSESGVIGELEAALTSRKKLQLRSKIDADYEKKRRSTLQRLNQYHAGTFELPIGDLSLPDEGLATRDVEVEHVFFLADQMEIQGPSYPGKAAVACAFGVVFSHSHIPSVCENRWTKKH